MMLCKHSHCNTTVKYQKHKKPRDDKVLSKDNKSKTWEVRRGISTIISMTKHKPNDEQNKMPFLFFESR